MNTRDGGRNGGFVRRIPGLEAITRGQRNGGVRRRAETLYSQEEARTMDDLPKWMYAIPTVLMVGVGAVGAHLQIRPLLFVGMPVALVVGMGIAYGLNRVLER